MSLLYSMEEPRLIKTARGATNLTRMPPLPVCAIRSLLTAVFVVIIVILCTVRPGTAQAAEAFTLAVRLVHRPDAGHTPALLAHDAMVMKGHRSRPFMDQEGP